MFDKGLGLLAVITIVSMICTLTFHGTVWRVIRRRTSTKRGPTPPISVLKPLCGLDEDLLANLRSIANQDYPAFELIFGFEHAGDPAAGVVDALRQEFPHIPITCVVTHHKIGRNPKVNNLAGMTKHARFEHLLISDANVRVEPTYLRRMIAELNHDKVGLVCSIVSGCHAQSVGALCEDLHLSTYIAPAVCGAFEIGKHPCVVGKSMLMRRSDLQLLGGWPVVCNSLAEDYILGERFASNSWQVRICPQVIQAVHLQRSVSEFVSRHIRWAQMRRRVSLPVYMGELLLNPAPFCIALILAAMANHPTPSWTAVVGGGVLLASKFLSDVALMKRLSGRRLAFWQLAVLPFKDCLTLYIWIIGCFRRTVTWRGHKLIIGRNTCLTSTQEEEPGLLVSSLNDQ